MNIVKCIKNNKRYGITIGKTYEIITSRFSLDFLKDDENNDSEISFTHVEIFNDKDNWVEIPIEYFEVIE